MNSTRAVPGRRRPAATTVSPPALGGRNSGRGRRLGGGRAKTGVGSEVAAVSTAPLPMPGQVHVPVVVNAPLPEFDRPLEMRHGQIIDDNDDEKKI